MRARFEIEGFEVWSPGQFSKSKGSRFGRVCSIPPRRVRGSVAWVLLRMKGSEFGRASPTPHNPLLLIAVAWVLSKVEGFEVWSPGLF